MNTKLVRIFLRDHIVALAAAVPLAERMLGATEDAEIRSFLEELLPGLRDDHRAAGELLRSIGGSPSRVLGALARLGEKAGRLKLNGALTGYTPLSRLVELEGLSAVLAADRSLWEGAEAAGLAGDDARSRAERASRWLEQANDLRREAAAVALGGGERRL